MIEIPVPIHGRFSTRLWKKYADAGYSKSGHIGFRAYVQALVPSAEVTGTTATGLVLKFNEARDATMFILRWM